MLDRHLSDEDKEEERSEQEATIRSGELTVRETSYTTEWGQGRRQHVSLRCLGMMEGRMPGARPIYEAPAMCPTSILQQLLKKREY